MQTPLRVVCVRSGAGPDTPEKRGRVSIYHLSVKTISRSAGRSATAAAAYRSGSEIVDAMTGEVHDYRHKAGVLHSELVLPDGAPSWASDRSQLWNAAEQAEKRKNSTVAREFELALPDELSHSERVRLARDFAGELVAKHRCAASVDVHAPGKEGDSRNHHAHLLLSTRRLGPDGFGEKTRELDDKKSGSQLVTEWRARFAELTNERLAQAGSSARVDHRSLEAQGIDRAPTVHMGPAATAMERRGIRSRRAQDNPPRREEPRHERDNRRSEQRRQRVAPPTARIDDLPNLHRIGSVHDLALPEMLLREDALADVSKQRAEGRDPDLLKPRQPVRRAEPKRSEPVKRPSAQLAEIEASIEKLRPPATAQLVDKDDQVRKMRAQRQLGQDLLVKAHDARERAIDAAKDWRKAHPLRAWLHDQGFIQADPLAEAQKRRQEAAQRIRDIGERLTLAKRLETEAVRKATDAAAKTRDPALKQIAALEAEAEKVKAGQDFRQEQGQQSVLKILEASKTRILMRSQIQRRDDDLWRAAIEDRWKRLDEEDRQRWIDQAKAATSPEEIASISHDAKLAGRELGIRAYISDVQHQVNQAQDPAQVPEWQQIAGHAGGYTIGNDPREDALAKQAGMSPEQFRMEKDRRKTEDKVAQSQLTSVESSASSSPADREAAENKARQAKAKMSGPSMGM